MELFLHAAENLIIQLETEMNIIKGQLPIIEVTPGLSELDVNSYLLEYNIDYVKHKYLSIYYANLMKTYSKNMSLKKAILNHISSLEATSINSFLFEIAGHQNALSELTNSSLYNNEGSAEKILKSIHNFFPFEIVLPMLLDYNFCSQFMGIISDYKPQDHKLITKKIFSLFGKFQSEKYTFIIISEIILSYFHFSKINNFDDFLFHERCRIIMSRDFQSLSISPNTISLFPSPQNSNNCLPLRPFTPQNVKKLEFFDNTKFGNEISGLDHIVMEFRKVACHSSLSLKMMFIIRVSDLLNSIISNINGFMGGADETFHLFVYIICDSRITNFVSTLFLFKYFEFTFLKTSKVWYLFEQMKIAKDFIETRALSTPKNVILPYLIEREHEQKELHKFVVKENKFLFYTGNDNDITNVYVYDFDEEIAGKEYYQIYDGCIINV